VLLKLSLDLVKHERACASLGQPIAEQPDGLGVWNAAALGQIEKLKEAGDRAVDIQAHHRPRCRAAAAPES
jgi:hypothetical protein